MSKDNLENLPENNLENLPIETNERGINQLLKNSPKLAKLADGLRRGGIITGSGVVSLAGFALIGIGTLPASIAGWGTFLVGTTSLIQNSLNKAEPSLLFTSKKVGDTIGIFQNPFNIIGAEKMRGYSNLQKASLMGLQTLVGFSRYKQNFRDMPFELDENGQKIYSPKFSTVTHSINLENLEHLQTLGYIKIDSMDEDFPLKTLDEKLMFRKGTPRRSFLLTEKLGFGNFKGARDALKAMISNDPKAKEKNSRVMKKVTFRLTDKPIDFEKIQEYSDPVYRKSLPEEQRRAASKIGLIARVIKSKGLEIKKDAFGRDVIKYPSVIERNKIIRKDKKSSKEAEDNRNKRNASDKMKEEKEQFDKRIAYDLKNNTDSQSKDSSEQSKIQPLGKEAERFEMEEKE